jgi:hypothetical protein
LISKGELKGIENTPCNFELPLCNFVGWLFSAARRKRMRQTKMADETASHDLISPKITLLPLKNQPV